MGFLAGKRALIVGLASQRSIAWGIAGSMHREGARLAFGYQGEKLAERAREMACEVESSAVFECDVSSDEDIERLVAGAGQALGGLDILVHSVGFAPREALAGGFTESTTREAWRIAQDVSAYSLVALARAARPMLADAHGSILTLSYLGAVRALPNYNVMGPAKASLEAAVRFLAQDLGPEGIRVNAISAGPIKTLAAAGIAGFRGMLSHVAQTAPLGRSVSAEEVGDAAAFLCSDLARGITAETLYVDAGYHAVAMTLPNER
ncbi:MAG TPA: enoyl-ACP reductase [Gammaproteobacteria bacterium]|nr:enoyl-ACP reductase [Gammaproteobacteria bacterium]